MRNVEERLTQLELELENARMVQAAFVPKSRAMTNVEVAIKSTPANGVGGDICDVFEADHGRTAIVIGDVSGKGMAAGLLAGMICGAVHSTTWMESSFHHADATERINDLLRHKTSADRFASLFWGYYEPENSTFCYINAGHLPMLLIRRKAGSDHRVERLEEGGPVLGIVEWGNYEQGIVHIEDGDLLVLFSDGIVEARNEDHDLFGEDRLLATIRQCDDDSPGHIQDAILRAVDAHVCQAHSSDDDQTLVIAEFRNVFVGISSSGIQEVAA
jgi:serine phosphatase RsbU (regulator of sigma subunit)